MLLRTFTLLSLLFSTGCFAQSIRTDTIARGYYLPLDANVMSCRITITPPGMQAQMSVVQGNKIPDSTIGVIRKLEPGSVVVYYELTVLKNGVPEKASSVRYVIGSKNTKPGWGTPYYPDTMSAEEISTIVLDRHVYSFSVSWILNGSMYNYDLTGNGVFGSAASAIEELPSGTKVYFENIRRKEDDGSLIIAPTEIHVVK